MASPSPPMSPSSKNEYFFKIVCIGDSGSGKSCLLLRYADNFFASEWTPTIGVDFKFKRINYNGKQIKLQVWDTAGQERFRSIVSSFFRGAHGVLICADTTNASTFGAIEIWLREVRTHQAPGVSLPCVLIGTKSDMIDERKVSFEDATKIAQKFGLQYFETSSKDDVGISQAVESLLPLMIEHFIPSLSQSAARQLDLDENGFAKNKNGSGTTPKKKDEGGCCG